MREREQRDSEVSALRRKISTLNLRKSGQLRRLRIVEKALVADRQLLAEERAENEKKQKRLETELSEKNWALKKVRRKIDDKSPERRHRSSRRRSSSRRRIRDSSRSPRRQIDRRSRALTPRTSVEQPKKQVKATQPACPPPPHAPAPGFCRPVFAPPFGNWGPPPPAPSPPSTNFSVGMPPRGL